jgi:hypothetical protein
LNLWAIPPLKIAEIASANGAVLPVSRTPKRPQPRVPEQHLTAVG